jgi:hypothetical protein
MDGFSARLEVTVGAPDPAVVQREAEVFGERYGDTAESLEQAYGGYAGQTLWLSVLDDLADDPTHDGAAPAVLGWARLLVPGPLQTKTLVDITRAPWHLDADEVAAAVGLDPHSCLDIATFGVRPDLGSEGARVTAALYHGMVMTTRVNGIAWSLAVLHVLVRRVMASTGLVMHPLPGARPAVYMDAPGFVPVYANMDRVLADQAVANPEAHRRVVLGDIPGLRIPDAEAFLLPLRRTVDLSEPAVVDLSGQQAVDLTAHRDPGRPDTRTA